MFANLSAEGWAIIITAVGSMIIMPVVTAIIGYKLKVGQTQLKAEVRANTAITEQTQNDINDTKQNLQETKKEINGRMTELIATSKAEGYASGLEQGRKEAALAILEAKAVEDKRKLAEIKNAGMR